MDFADCLTKNQTETFSQTAEVTAGEVPEDLRGTLMRNGPGTLTLGGQQLHYFDGHSMVATLAFSDESAQFHSTYPATKTRVAEKEADRILHRRLFTNVPGWFRNVFNLKLGNPASHDVFKLGDKILATDVGGHHALDAQTLEDRGEFDWGGLVPAGHQICAMPRDDGEHVVLFTVEQGGAKNDVVTFKEVDPKLKVVGEASVEVEGFMHDHAFTENWFVGVDNPLAPNMFNLLSGRTTLWRALSPTGTAPVLKLVARGGSGKVETFPLNPPVRTMFHIINAFEDGDEVVVDCVGYPEHVRFDYITPPELRRGVPVQKGKPGAIIRLRANVKTRDLSQTTLVDAAGDGPEVDPRRHGKDYRHAWLSGVPTPNVGDPNFFFWSDTVLHVDTVAGKTQRWTAAGYQLSPPAFAPRAGSVDAEDGYLLSWMLKMDDGTTEVAVLDATNIEAGPIAKLAIGPYLPPASHCRFAPA